MFTVAPMGRTKELILFDTPTPFSTRSRVTGLLTLTDAQVLYEPEWVIMSEHAQDEGENTVIPLSDVQDAFRGEWWDIPCLMIRTPRVTYRYGWPAERRELETIFDVDEWVASLRELLGGGG